MSAKDADTNCKKFLKWADAQGIRTEGVKPVRFPERGLGIAASRKIEVRVTSSSSIIGSSSIQNYSYKLVPKPQSSVVQGAGETIVSVPTSALLTLDTVPVAFKNRFPANTPVQCLFAAYLAYDGEARSRYASWKATWPTMENFEESIPLLWPAHLLGTQHSSGATPRQSGLRHDAHGFSSLLPPSISGFWHTLPKKPQGSTDYVVEQQNLFQNQSDRLQKALDIVKQVYPSMDQKEYTYYWLVANTRCFFYVGKAAEMPEDRNDAMALCPFADYFNHSGDDDGCEAAFNESGYTFTTTKSYEEGEEIFICYGNHTSDLLLADYGFCPYQNKWDTLFLDDIVLQNLNREKKQYLKDNNYLGNYRVASSGPCFRTEVVASLMYLATEDWCTYVAGVMPPTFNQSKTDDIIADWISQYREESVMVTKKIEKRLVNKTYEDDSRFQVLLFRWRQIASLCGAALRGLEQS
ncbi:hypothetical protein LOZ66_002709 [Ophidiomyces ophidiicola]|nr:hypothetical protein LOZ65_004527 [Ophidiomyces ophidiicola]KAI1939397.1 hypothetical protein LOZ66_002709 [Ophidiomyces ophidiicola]